jgi:hypothetical protein
MLWKFLALLDQFTRDRNLTKSSIRPCRICNPIAHCHPTDVVIQTGSASV